MRWQVFNREHTFYVEGIEFGIPVESAKKHVAAVALARRYVGCGGEDCFRIIDDDGYELETGQTTVLPTFQEMVNRG